MIAAASCVVWTLVFISTGEDSTTFAVTSSGMVDDSGTSGSMIIGFCRVTFGWASCAVMSSVGDFGTVSGTASFWFLALFPEVALSLLVVTTGALIVTILLTGWQAAATSTIIAEQIYRMITNT